MRQALRVEWMAAEQDQRIGDAIRKERDRLRNFIRRRVGDAEDTEDVLQDVFYELLEAERLMRPIDEIGAWLYRVARNRITDLFRRCASPAARAGCWMRAAPCCSSAARCRPVPLASRHPVVK